MVVLLHQLSPSSTCIAVAGVGSRPTVTAEIEKPHKVALSSYRLGNESVALPKRSKQPYRVLPT
jgi:hypothetical protein